MADVRHSTRQEEVAYHKEMVRRLKREISLIDRHSRRKYIREFDEEFRAYQDLSSFDDLVVSAYKADIIYIGDYHALPQAQMFASRLLHEIASRSRNVHLGMEMVFGRNQRLLDKWLQGGIDEGEFLKRIRYHLDWGYEWSSFRRLFEVAREHEIPVLALDCEPRNGFRYIRKRDQYAAQRLVSTMEANPQSKVVVVFGESHLASDHLPGKVRELLKKRNMERRSWRSRGTITSMWSRAARRGSVSSTQARSRSTSRIDSSSSAGRRRGRTRNRSI